MRHKQETSLLLIHYLFNNQNNKVTQKKISQWLIQ